MREIAECMAAALADGRDIVLITIAGGKGSAPRHAGSQMLVDARGLACGTIGGGALEGHAIAQARALLGSGQGRFEHLDLVVDLGMGCGGQADLLYTAVRGGDARWVQVVAYALRCMDERTPAKLAFRCCRDGRPFAADVALLNADGEVIAGDCAAPDWFIMPLAVPVRAVVFGGGHVGRATVDALSRVGFACTLFDSRPEFARSEDFPDACEVLCGSFDDIAASLALDARDFVLIMTPGHNSDFAVLEQVLRQPHAYVGLIGSRRKIAAARQRMQEAGVPQAAIDAVHMPIGLAIGAETPEEIAVSIAAECIQARAALRQ